LRDYENPQRRSADFLFARVLPPQFLMLEKSSAERGNIKIKANRPVAFCAAVS
jgi:hypothetical protein